MKIVVFGAILLLISACTSKELVLPDVEPVPTPSLEDVAAFQAPSLYAPPVEVPQFSKPPAPKPPGANETRYQWVDGKASLVKVQVGYPTVIRLQPEEKITSIVDGDRAPITEEEAATTKQRPQQEKQTLCAYGARWQYCKGISESQWSPIESVAFTATQVGHKSGLIIFTTQRTYSLELQAVAQTNVRLVTWDVPPPPSVPPPPQPPSLLPNASTPHVYHVGYLMSSPGTPPDWVPLQVVSDLPTVPSAKMYLRFAPVVLHQRMPLLRGMTEQGKPYLLNARQYGEWVVVDELAPRLELRRGAGKEAETVALTRGELRTIHCPHDPACPLFHGR